MAIRCCARTRSAAATWPRACSMPASRSPSANPGGGSAPGVRISIVQYFGRWYLAGAETSPISQAMLDRNPPRFAQLVRGRQGYAGLGAVKLQAAKETLYG